MSDILELLDGLDKLHEVATPAPWNSHATDDDYFMNARFIGTRPSDGWHDDGNGLAVGFPDQEPPENVIAITLLQHPRLADNEKCDDNMDLIVALRNAYPAMAAEIRRLREENERMRKALEWYSNEENYTIAHSEYDGVIIDGGERALRALEEADA